MQQDISLKELLSAVKYTIDQTFDSTYWVRAEISDLREDVSRGHCYLELVEKNDRKLIEAKVRANIWANTYRMIKPFFLQETGQLLQTGMKVLVEVSISFHEQFGLSCVIQNIDPTFTMGDIAKKKQETIRQLKEDGVWDMNKSIPLPTLIQRVAIISSSSAAGYEDFCNQISNNGHNFNITHKLFQATMQGDQAAQSVADALDKVFAEQEKFDVVVIIRGGGATTDLLAFDEYILAVSVANFPLPILTGIGHERDESVTDMVAHTRCKTPTAVAAFIVNHLIEAENHLLDIQSSIHNLIKTELEEQKLHLDNYAEQLRRTCNYYFNLESQLLKLKEQQLKSLAKSTLDKQIHHLSMKENTLRLLSPETLLKRGYSITLCKGKVVKNVKSIKAGEELETILSNGSVKSIAQ